MNFKKSLALAALMASCAFANAAETFGADVGPYIAIDSGLVGVDAINLDSNNALGYSLVAGWNFNRNYGAEVSVSRFGRRSIVSKNNGYLLPFDTKAVGIVGTGRIPLMDRLDGVGRLGIAKGTYIDCVDTVLCPTRITSKWDFMGGIGLDYRLSLNYSLRANIDVYPGFAGEGPQVTVLTVGIKYGY